MLHNFRPFNASLGMGVGITLSGWDKPGPYQLQQKGEKTKGLADGAGLDVGIWFNFKLIFP